MKLISEQELQNVVDIITVSCSKEASYGLVHNTINRLLKLEDSNEEELKAQLESKERKIVELKGDMTSLETTIMKLRGETINGDKQVAEES